MSCFLQICYFLKGTCGRSRGFLAFYQWDYLTYFAEARNSHDGSFLACNLQNLPAHGKRRPLPVEISQTQLTNKKQEKKLLSLKNLKTSHVISTKCQQKPCPSGDL